MPLKTKNQRSFYNPDGTINNLPNALNPAFYRKAHLDVARSRTLVSQGGYLELNEENDEYVGGEEVTSTTNNNNRINR